MAGNRTWSCACIVFLMFATFGWGFIPVGCIRRRLQRSGPSLNGIAEWRNFILSQPNGIYLLPFSPTEALVPGQSRTILLKEGRFFDLVDDVIEKHNSIVGMVLMGDDGIIMHGMPLCEIVNVEVFAGFRGKVTIEITLESVGRAKLVELTQMKPSMMGRCMELVDDRLDGKRQDLKASRDIVRQLEETLKAMPSGCYYSDYSNARVSALRVLTDEANDKETNDLTAISWALIACLPTEIGSEVALKAIATVDLLHRLHLGAKAILEEQIRPTQSQNASLLSDGVLLERFEGDTSLFE